VDEPQDLFGHDRRGRGEHSAQSYTAHQLSCYHLSVGETDEAVNIHTLEYPGCPT